SGSRAGGTAGSENVTLEPKQAQPDPYSTTMKLPKPEDPAAFEVSMELGKEIGAEILIATDPDAVRLGKAALLENGEYEVLTGNQIAALIVDYLLKAYEQHGT